MLDGNDEIAMSEDQQWEQKYEGVSSENRAKPVRSTTCRMMRAGTCAAESHAVYSPGGLSRPKCSGYLLKFGAQEERLVFDPTGLPLPAAL